MPWIPNAPNPGSRDAKKSGCLCPIMDNGHGIHPPIPAGTPWGGTDGAWYIVVGCPVHDVPSTGLEPAHP